MSESPNRPRRLPFTGVVNFRDLGGYLGAGGRRMQWGQIYRSDVLADLTDRDMTLFESLGLKTICDLRGPQERTSKPNRDFAHLGVSYHTIGFMPHRGDELLAETKSGSISTAEIEARVQEIYRRFVNEQCETFQKLLQFLIADSLPLLVHCTSGRDRTGFASAIILMALGVNRETIASDYALSNDYRRDLTFQIGGEVEATVMHTLTNANPVYLDAAFEAIDARWGSETNYLRNALHLSAADQDELQNKLLGKKQGEFQ